MEEHRNAFDDSNSGFPKFGNFDNDHDDVNDRLPFGSNPVIMPGGVRGNNNIRDSNGFDADPDEGERASLVQQPSNKMTAPQSKGEGQKVDVTIKTIADPTVANPNLPPFISKFPISDRIFSMSLFNCFKEQISPRS